MKRGDSSKTGTKKQTVRTFGFGAYPGDVEDMKFIMDYLGSKNQADAIRTAVRAYAHSLRTQRRGGG